MLSLQLYITVTPHNIFSRNWIYNTELLSLLSLRQILGSSQTLFLCVNERKQQVLKAGGALSLLWCPNISEKWMQSAGATKPHQSIIWLLCLCVSQQQVLLCEWTGNMQLVSVLRGNSLCPRLKGWLGFGSRCSCLFDLFCFQQLEPDRFVSSIRFYFWIQLPCRFSVLPGG